MKMINTAAELLPFKLPMDELCGKNIEEFRIRRGQPPTALYDGREHKILDKVMGESELMRIMEKATDASLHSSSSSLRRGFVSYRGLRIGVCGRADHMSDGICDFQTISSLAIRIPAEHKGIMDETAAKIALSGMGGVLIIAPPGGGKTSALRELVRILSDRGFRVCIADERNEIALLDRGGFGFDIGTHTDVMTDVPKAKAALMMLRAMNPQIIAFDEITDGEDVEAVREISACGVQLIATLHANVPEDLRKNDHISRLLDRGVFRYIVTINQSGGTRHYRTEEIA